MTIDQIPNKENMTAVTDPVHQLSADEMNAIVGQVRSNMSSVESVPVTSGTGDHSLLQKNAGNHSKASGDSSAAFGRNNQAIGRSSLANGEANIARGVCSHSEGWRTETHNECEFACGRYNESTESASKDKQTLFSIGIGDGEQSDGTYDKKNAFEAKRNGDLYMWLAGKYVKLQDVIKLLNYYTEGSGTASIRAGSVSIEADGSGTTLKLKGYRVEVQSGLDDIVLQPGPGYKAKIGAKEIATVDMLESIKNRLSALENNSMT